jgi:hypothetical protein
MEPIYDWLYDAYAAPLLQEHPAFRSELLERLAAEAVPGERPLWLIDRLNEFQLNWCTAAFEAGVRLGMQLSVKP